jgi:hypothetical protein
MELRSRNVLKCLPEENYGFISDELSFFLLMFQFTNAPEASARLSHEFHTGFLFFFFFGYDRQAPLSPVHFSVPVS